jgi:putative ABC transport system permease protein
MAGSQRPRAFDFRTGPDWFARRAREAWQAIGSRGPRALLTALGLAVGIGGFITTTSVGASASAQISRDLDALRSSSLEIQPAIQGPAAAIELLSAEPRVDRLTGVTQTGVRFQILGPSGGAMVVSLRHGDSPAREANLICATPSYLQLVDARTSSTQTVQSPARAGQSDGFLIGAGLAQKMGISASTLPTLVWIGSDLRSVTGVVTASNQDPDLLISLIENADSCASYKAVGSVRMLVNVLPGWGGAVRGVAPLAVSPTAPDKFLAVSGSEAVQLRQRISSSNGGLLFAISAMALVLGSIVVCMTMLVAVLERRAEIGVRRAVGATRWAIAIQFTTEAAIIGLIGGALGTATGAALGALIAALRNWPSGLSVPVLAAGPALGLIVGVVAGLYPAIRATRVEPLEALRS